MLAATTATAAQPPRRTARSERRAEALAGYALIAIPIALFLILNIGSIIYAFFISFWNWTIGGGGEEVVGLANYQQILNDTIFHRAVYNSITYAIVVVPLEMALGLALAVIVNSHIRGKTFFRAAFYFPALASSAAITVLFIFIMQPFGLFNEARAALGLNPLFEAFGFNETFNWLGNQRTAWGSIMFLNVWTTSGTMMLFYLASLQTINTEVYEASALDGANAWQTFWKITFPLLRPGHYFVLTVALIGALQVFDQSFIVGGSNGGPNYSTMSIVLYLYSAAFGQFRLGYAAAVGIILFIIIFGATLLQRRLFGQAPSW
jgi:multiple sugar transport system permease protein